MNYYDKQVIILIKKHYTVDRRWDCNVGISRLVNIFSLKCKYQQSVKSLGRHCGFVLRAQIFLFQGLYTQNVDYDIKYG